jgi:hypothetical protein
MRAFAFMWEGGYYMGSTSGETREEDLRKPKPQKKKEREEKRKKKKLARLERQRSR